MTATFDESKVNSIELKRITSAILSTTASEAPDGVSQFILHAQNSKRAQIKLSSGQSFSLDLSSSLAALVEWETCAEEWLGFPKSANKKPTPKAEPKGGEQVVTGTGIIIATDGYVVTNAHVVKQCSRISVGQDGKSADATLLHSDVNNDLALLQAKTTFQRIAQIAEQPLELGAKVAVFGFPLTGSLSSGGNFTVGSVSGLTGFRDDKRVLQITAPIQAGNSGGPVVDRKGRLVGVVRATLGTSRPGENIQNVNFAIRVAILKEFLDARKAPYTLASGPPGRDRPDTDLAAGAKAIATLVVCQQKG
jgi:S1-C subfamily serine protease